MGDFTLYDPATGRILGTCTAPGTACPVPVMLGITAQSLDGSYDGATQYVASGAVTARPAMTLTADKTAIAANGSDTATLSGFPPGSSVAIDGGAPQALGTLTSDSLTADVPGSYVLTFSCWPYLDASLTITAT